MNLLTLDWDVTGFRLIDLNVSRSCLKIKALNSIPLSGDETADYCFFVFNGGPTKIDPSSKLQ